MRKELVVALLLVAGSISAPAMDKVRVEAKIDATAVYTRRHFDVVAEHLRSDIDLIASPAYGVSWHR